MIYTQGMADADASPASDSDLKSLGVKRKDMFPSTAAAEPMSSKEYDNEIVYPQVSVDGKQAEAMGAADLEQGECVKQTVIWKVEKRVVTEQDGKKEYRMELHLVKGSDLESCDEPDDEKSDKSRDDDSASDEDEADQPSPGMAFILSGKAKDAD